MRGRRWLAAAVVVGVFATGTGTAAAWDLIHEKSGIGSVTLRAWTRGYDEVAYVADHPGTRVDVSVVVNCRNGDSYDQTFTDGGGRFRLVLNGMRNSGRCNHTFKVVARRSSAELDLFVAAR
jgi:hypothetical protein